MMQSLLLNGSASVKNNDLKIQEENDSRINSLKSSKLAEQQRNFARVMQDSLDKESTRAQSRQAAKQEEVNRDSRSQNIMANDKPINDSKVSKKEANHHSDKKSIETENVDKKSKTYDDEKVDKSKKLTGNDESKVNDGKINSSIDPSKVELGAESEYFTDETLFEKFNNEVKENEDDIDLIDLESIELSDVELSDVGNGELPEGDIGLINSNLKQSNLDVTIQDSEEIASTGTEDNISEELDTLGQSSLLSQIEAAQKADTKVNNEKGEVSDINMPTLKKQFDTINTEEKKTALLANQVKVDPDVQVEIDAQAELEIGFEDMSQKKSTLKLEADVSLDKDLDTLMSESESSLQPLKSQEKADSFSNQLKNEAAIANQSVTDVNGAKPNQTNQVQLDKLVAFNQQAPATNNLLQEPLDIQSKHAAAMMGERVMMMLSQGKQEVQIRLDPAELGSMLIKVQVQQDQVQLHIQTQAGLSKDIIEQNMPRLREQLAQQGIQLSEANVQQQSQQQPQQQKQGQSQINNASGQLTSTQEVINEQNNAFIPSKIPSLEQGIDYYA